jgi:hypothetical protein
MISCVNKILMQKKYNDIDFINKDSPLHPCSYNSFSLDPMVGPQARGNLMRLKYSLQSLENISVPNVCERNHCFTKYYTYESAFHD